MISDERLVRIVPSQRQLRFQQLEFYAFIHFTVNTFTDKEWGDGTESPDIFTPSEFDAEQWVKAVISAGMKGLILTCKHHDGFCLWDTKLTAHNTMNSPFGRDIVREVSSACRKYGISFGVYLSPWDRNCPLYGRGREYDDFFVGQLTELLTGYGDIFSVWFDGACGEGPDGRKQYYDWNRYYSVIRELQPGACISVCGPDVRWCGNEAGQTRTSEWSVVPRRTMDTEKIASLSQHAEDDSFRRRPIRAQDQDLGSREILREEKDLIWYPAEVNTSIRPGWFWHAAENDQVKPLSQLIEIYEKSVGGNATFLLNIPPNREGLLDAPDVRRLREFGAYLQRCYTRNLAPEAMLAAEEAEDGHEAERMLEKGTGFYLPRTAGTPVRITLRWPSVQRMDRVVLQEEISQSQRIERFHLEVPEGEGWRTVAEGTVVGYKRIVNLPGLRTSALRLVIDDARVRPTLAFLGVYAEQSP